jgi:hypothetical protein
MQKYNLFPFPQNIFSKKSDRFMIITVPQQHTKQTFLQDKLQKGVQTNGSKRKNIIFSTYKREMSC